MKNKPRDSTQCNCFLGWLWICFRTQRKQGRAWKTLLVCGTGLETLLLSDLHDAVVGAAAMRSLSDTATQAHQGWTGGKKLPTRRNILFYFFELLLDSEEKLFGRVYQHTGSTNNSTMLLGLFSIVQCCKHKAWLRVCHAADIAACACNALMSRVPN